MAKENFVEYGTTALLILRSRVRYLLRDEGPVRPSASITNACHHKQATCLPCLQTSITHDIENKGVRSVACPEFDAKLGYDDVNRWADKPTRIRYEHLQLRAALQDDEAFVWVSGPIDSRSHIVIAENNCCYLF